MTLILSVKINKIETPALPGRGVVPVPECDGRGAPLVEGALGLTGFGPGPSSGVPGRLGVRLGGRGDEGSHDDGCGVARPARARVPMPLLVAWGAGGT